MPNSLLAGVRSEVTGKRFQSKSHTLAKAKQPLLTILIRATKHKQVSQHQVFRGVAESADPDAYKMII